MHIHGSVPNVQGADFYSVANGERAAATRRAAETRKRLLRLGQEDQDNLSPEENTLMGRWMNAQLSQGQSEDEYHSPAAGKDPDFG